MKCFAVFGMVLALLAMSGAPTEKRSELDWSTEIAAQIGGVAEYRLPDGSRVDILVPRYAIEVDWADAQHGLKWAEGVGQARYYAVATGRRPCVLLLMDGSRESHQQYLRCLSAIGPDGLVVGYDVTTRRSVPPLDELK